MSQPAAGPQRIDPLMSTLSAAAEQGRSLLDSSFRTWTAEVGAFFDELAKDDAEAAEEISKCQTPFELLAVQQKWFAGCAEAYMNAGLRMALGAVLEPEAVAAEEAGAWRLPE